MLILDSEAISAVANGPAGCRDRVRALVTEMRKRELPIATVAAVLAEVIRGRPRDASVFATLRRERVEVYSVDTRVAIRAGQLLESACSASENAVAAFVVAVADLEGGAVIATTDTEDIERFASYASYVAVADIKA